MHVLTKSINNDPGIPPHPGRSEPKKMIQKAMQYVGRKYSTLVALSLSKA